MGQPVIRAVGHVALRVRDLDASVDVATTIMGLAERRRSGSSVFLTHGAPDHSLEYIAADEDALDHIGLEAPDAQALAEVRRRVDAAGLAVLSDAPLDPGAGDGFAFVGPEGFVFEVYRDMPHVPLDHRPTGVRPNRFGHVNITVTDLDGMLDVLTGVLDFRISDRVTMGAWLRCNVDHHGIAVARGERAVLHHHAWEVQSTVEVGLLADRIDESGRSVLWGPVRHGCGRNIATYFQDPSGAVVEYYSDMERFYSDEDQPVRSWDEADHKWFSLWSPDFPGGFIERGVPPVRRDGVAA
ncbi:unannotated protein [freshwater metagenome]|uniref:Unannotated protein n=1 Tax=freshwater metagenome TaxID=449393 RepID=A0A6J7I9J3_9ZZZZ|nr:hypothetical protein [Actinomycetota bacterium]